MDRGQIVALATEVIPPENTPEKAKTDTLIAHPQWKYIGPADSIRFEWQIGKWGWAGFAGETSRKYATRAQPPSTELQEFSTSLPAISLSPLSPGYYDCEIWFKDKFADLRVIVENCVRIVEVAPAEYTLTITLNPPVGGYVTMSPEPTPPGYSYASGTMVTLTANPYPDYEFDHWSGAVSGTSRTVSVSMSSDKTVIANFRGVAPPTGYTLSLYQAFGVQGTVTKDPDKPLYDRFELVVIRATPPPDYAFDYWLIRDQKRSYNPASIIMTQDSVATVYYKLR
ncbi:hypothetical protein ES703_105441 [subsurface metagenome]